MADTSAVTVETPSRLVLFYPPTLCTNISAYLPTNVIKRPIRDKVTIGRSSTSDIRLNDERMSRSYAEIWHDGVDPFVFKIKNISDRKILVVGSEVLRSGEQGNIKDGCTIKLDFIEFRAKVCAGDFSSLSYEISFVRNEVFRRVSEEGPHIIEDRTPCTPTPPSPSLLDCLRSRQDSNVLDSVFLRSNTTPKWEAGQGDGQMPTTPVNDLDSGFVLDTSGVYRPNISSGEVSRNTPRCQSCQNQIQRGTDREILYHRGRLSPCENSDVYSDGTADDNDVM